MPDCDDLRRSGGESLRTKPGCPKLNGQAMRLALRFIRRPRLTRWGSRLPIPSIPPVALSSTGQDRLRPNRGEKICL